MRCAHNYDGRDSRLRGHLELILIRHGSAERRNRAAREQGRGSVAALSLPRVLLRVLLQMLLALGLGLATMHPLPASGQASEPAAAETSRAESQLTAWEGKPVIRIEFEGVAASRLEPLPAQLAQQPETALSGEKVRQSLRRLFATGLYDTIAAEGRLDEGAGGVVLVFRGQARIFIGTVTVTGAAGANTERAAGADQPVNAGNAIHADGDGPGGGGDAAFAGG